MTVISTVAVFKKSHFNHFRGDPVEPHRRTFLGDSDELSRKQLVTDKLKL